jgi:hypothetical protein
MFLVEISGCRQYGVVEATAKLHDHGADEHVTIVEVEACRNVVVA